MLCSLANAETLGKPRASTRSLNQVEAAVSERVVLATDIGMGVNFGIRPSVAERGAGTGVHPNEG